MHFESARLVYVPFKLIPAGHVFLVFIKENGEEVAISPEADITSGASFSLVRGMRKTYLLRYLIQHPNNFHERYSSQNRKVREYELNLTKEQIRNLYERMHARASSLQSKREWYHTLFNSCVTNIMMHLDETRDLKRSLVSRALVSCAPFLLE